MGYVSMHTRERGGGCTNARETHLVADVLKEEQVEAGDMAEVACAERGAEAARDTVRVQQKCGFD